MPGKPPHGYPIVLTADRTLMADYPTLLDGMMGTIQTTSSPSLAIRRFLAPPMPQNDGQVARAPLGLRRVEAALREGGVAPGDIAIVAPSAIAQAVGPDTRILGVSSGDPLGYGMSNTTMVAMSGGQLYTERWYAELMAQAASLKGQFPNLRIVAGGPGAWQLANQPHRAAAMGIDTIFTGYFERDGVPLFRRLLAGEGAAQVVQGGRVELGQIPTIAGPSSMGVVEISRGCGRGCGFCTMACEPMIHLPIERVLADVQANLNAGVRSLALISEDFLRYGCTGTTVRPEPLLELLERVRSLSGVRMVQVDHVNVSSVMQYSPQELRAVCHAMTGTTRNEMPWVNMGVETASGELLFKAGLGGKLHPFAADQWTKLCERAVLRLIEAGFVPMMSMVMGLPGETPKDVERTVALLRRLEGRRLVAFPIFYAPLNPGERPFGLADMSPEHWRLFRLSYDFNFRWIPPMFWDNHRAAGAPMWRRLFIQTAGRAQKMQWKLKFIRATGRLRP